MTQAVVTFAGLSASPLDAAAEFHRTWLAQARAAAKESDLVLVFAQAGPEHRAWRLAAVQELARETAPRRVNAVAGGDEAAVAEAIAWLETSPGITGQILAVDGKSAEIG